MADPSSLPLAAKPGRLTEAQVLRTGRILARLRNRIDQMLDEVEECAKVLTSEGERVTVTDNAFDHIRRIEGGDHEV